MGSSPFARHYSGSRDFFPFLRVLRCVTSPACLYPPYVFRREYARITTRGFPHSEILGSTVDQHLPEAYRSRPRPSSASGAKASTACPSYLDERTHQNVPLCSFQGTPSAIPIRGQTKERPEERRYAPGRRMNDRRPRILSGSLKAEQHAVRTFIGAGTNPQTRLRLRISAPR